MTIWERVHNALSGLGVPVAANVYIADSGTAWPDEYAVYQVVVSTPTQHADDSERLREWLVQVTTWKRGGLLGAADVAGAMRAAGFLADEERELPYSRDTGHYGIARDYRWYEVVG